MAYVALGLLVAGIILGRLWARHGPRLAAKGPWRPAASLAALLGALVCAVREAFGPAAVLIALALYLMLQARRRGTAAPEPKRAPPRPLNGAMSLTQAASLLGLEPEADREAVQAAYVRLMRMAHPDRGGTSGLAAQLNLARRVMLEREPGGWV